MPKLTVADTPAWLADILLCPECKGACWLTSSGGMSCRASPAHTGLIREADWHKKVTSEYAMVYGQNRTVLRLEEALWLAKKWLESMRDWKTKPTTLEGEKK